MRVALLSDIHSNLQALEAVMESLRTHRVDKIVVLGDIVGYNANPVECIQRVKQVADISLLGNHDAAALNPDSARFFNANAKAGLNHTIKHLGNDEIQYLKELQPKVDAEFDKVRFSLVHGSMRDPLSEYVFPGMAATMLEWLHARLPDDGPRVVAQGHTHIPMYLTKASGRTYPIHLVNPGSVGQPRDGDPRASFAIFDTSTRMPTFHRVAYDIQGAVRANEAAQLPKDLSRLLILGS
ncbi:MAG TPA: metallophosphoesterase family protein [Candidatus Thermoplasmatota archaeon]|nr:metallophosphoesterase family protein [Candidatus Thermoplasmatota archaeon]